MSRQRCFTWVGGAFLLFVVCLMPFVGVLAAERTEIRVGVVNCVTGRYAMVAAEQKWAYDQAEADINKKGGVMVKELGKRLPIRLIVADDKSMPDGAAAAMERLIKVDKIDCALGSSDSSLNVAAGTIAEKYKIFYFQRSWPEAFEPQNFKWVSNFFFSAVGAGEVPFKIWKALPEADAIKRPALMTEDNQDGQAFGGAFKDASERYGYKFVADVPYAPGAKDFSAQILKMKAENADALLWFGAPSDGITLLRQMKNEKGMKLRYIHGWKGFWTREFQKALGNDSDYIIHDGFWTANNGVPGSKELGEKFTKKFGRDSVSVGLDYAEAQILALAIEKAGSFDSAKIRDLVYSGEFSGHTIMGDFKFNAKGMFNTESFALQWWKGERMQVWPPRPDVWKVKLIPVQ